MEDDPKKDKSQAPQNEDDPPAIYSVSHVDGQPKLSRRTFIEMVAAAAGTAALPSSGFAAPMKRQTGFPVAHKNAVTALAVNSAGKLLVSGDKDGVLKLWQLPQGALLNFWAGHNAAISCIAFPRMEDSVWSLDSSGDLKRWRLPDGKEITDGKFVRGSQKGGYLFAAPGAADWYAIRTSNGGVELRSQMTGETLLSLKGLDDKVAALAATSDGHLLLAGGEAGKICMVNVFVAFKADSEGLWTRPAGTHAQTVQTDPVPLSALNIAPNGTLALSAHANGQLRTWQMPELGSGTVYDSSLGKPLCVAIRPQLDLFVAGTDKPQIGLWKLGSAAASPQALTGHAAAVRATVITPDGSLLISGSEDKTIRLWSLPNGKYLRNLVDLAINYKSVEGTSYKGTDIYGRTITFTLPCGSPIPPGAVCVCNCVPGAMVVPKNHSQKYDIQGYCTCDLICTCNTVCTCQSVGGGGHVISYWYPN